MDFSNVFTVEVNADKGWEVFWTSHSMNDAVRKFRQASLQYPELEIRLTAPKAFQTSEN